MWGGAEYQAPVSERLRIRAGAQASRREYAGSDFDQHFAALHLGPRWLVDAATEASFLASARQSWSGAPDYRDLGARLEVARWLGPRVTAFAHASWHDRSYRSRTHLDGPVWDATLRGSWVVLPTVRADLSAGYAQQRPKSRRERHQGRWLGTGVTVALPLGFTVGGAAEMRWTDYERGWFPFVADNGAREDRTRSFRLSAHNRAFTLAGFSPELAVIHERRDSNAQLHDYRRTSGELRFVRGSSRWVCSDWFRRRPQDCCCSTPAPSGFALVNRSAIRTPYRATAPNVQRWIGDDHSWCRCPGDFASPLGRRYSLLHGARDGVGVARAEDLETDGNGTDLANVAGNGFFPFIRAIWFWTPI